MSDKPVIAAKTPAQVEVDAGETYYWCRCGRSSNQPFCDGSHSVTDITSDMSFGALSEEAKTALARGAEMAGTAGSAPAKEGR